VYAGLDKLLDPAFLQASGRTSIAAQMAGWVHVSPIGGLVQLALPYALPIGLGIALAEVGIGLGAVLGLAYRLAALGGVLLSTLFLLTASWAVRPFYLGNDLPYALGWATLLIAGSGGVLALDDVLARRSATGTVAPASDGSWQQGPPAAVPAPPMLTAPVARRALLRAGVLGVVAISVAGVATVAQVALGRRGGFIGGPVGGPGSSPSPEPTAVAIASPSPVPSPPPVTAPSPSPRPTPLPSPTPIPGKLLARIADVTPSRPVVFQDPFTSDPGVLLKLKDGSFVAFDAVCTHAGCTVEFEEASGLLVCPCHGATFDPERNAKAIDGPTFQPLMAFPIVVDTVAGTIRLAAE
jgi:thiosulfate dehydrogenase (quinone) large subunit